MVVAPRELLMQMKLLGSDLMMVGMYVLCFIGIILVATRRQGSVAEFVLAGRKLTLPLFVATLVATWYGGIFGIAEFTGRAGLGAWLTQGLLWYGAYIAFAFFLARRICAMPLYTVPDILEARFNKTTALVGGIFTYGMVNPAPYLLSLGIVVQIFTGLPLMHAILLSTGFIIGYTLVAGFRGLVYSDTLQCLWMYLAFGCLAIAAVATFGGPAFLDRYLTQIPQYRYHLTLTGGLPILYILVWGGLASWVMVDPNFYQRCYAATSPEVARRGVLVATLCWAVFDIFSCSTALYAFAARNANLVFFDNPQMAHLALADSILPSPLKGLFLVGVVATILSTADALLFAGAVNIARDYYWRCVNRQASDRQMLRMTRCGIVITAVLAALLALMFPSIVDLWYLLGTVGLSALLIPMLWSFSEKHRCATAATSSMVAGALIALSWLILGGLGYNYPWGVPPLYPGLLTSALTYWAVYRIKQTRC